MDEDKNYVWVSIATGKVYFNIGKLKNYSADLLKCHFEIKENLAKPKLFITYTQPCNEFLRAFYLLAPDKHYYFVIPTESYKIIE